MTVAVSLPLATIGLVDDDPSVRRAVRRLLRSHGYFCKSYESAEMALADPELRELDCLVLDVQLPAANGFELRDQLQARGLRIPYMFITAHVDSDSPEWAIQIGGSPYLKKPFEPAELISWLEVLLGFKAH